MTSNQADLASLQHRIDLLEKQLKRQRLLGILGGLALLAAALSSFVAARPPYLHVRGITVEDAAGKARILIGAPAETAGRRRKDAGTASLVVLGPKGQDRLILGEAPNPVLQGKVYPRIAASYGLTIHDSTGQERGGMSFLDNGRGVIALDRHNQDAVELIVNDKTGFAGLTMNYERPFGQYKEAVRIGTKGTEVWWALSDTAETERASLYIRDAAAPKLSVVPAARK
ncbi:hypothetical protein [Hymenobacter chitinivorans]|uniref:Uncharacterized protein n=1 Tax=Hymenobacter chitinivorans DSM 11115 TaxID=1121954 RepID=A0A2M9BQR0_9BACT|nr:hypothetical protein [Hymenobacter chitinivorans]PJJ60283.1 hypothetical protein CLV45_1708 [Hymenobacter chitinivorans DSM 11115]